MGAGASTARRHGAPLRHGSLDGSTDRMRVFVQDLYKEGNSSANVEHTYRQRSSLVRDDPARRRELERAYRHVQGSLRLDLTPTLSYSSESMLLDPQTAAQCLRHFEHAPPQPYHASRGLFAAEPPRGSRRWCEKLVQGVKYRRENSERRRASFTREKLKGYTPGYTPRTQCDRDLLAGVASRCVPSWSL